MIKVTCPTCGGHMGELPDLDRVKDQLSPTELKVAKALQDAGAGGLDIIDVAAALYGEGRTDHHALDMARKMVSRARQKLAPYGYHIPTNQALRMARYRLLPAEVGA